MKSNIVFKRIRKYIQKTLLNIINVLQIRQTIFTALLEFKLLAWAWSSDIICKEFLMSPTAHCMNWVFYIFISCYLFDNIRYLNLHLCSYCLAVLVVEIVLQYLKELVQFQTGMLHVGSVELASAAGLVQLNSCV